MNLFRFLLPPWVKPACAAVALVAAFSAGWRIESLRWTAHEAKALSEAQKRFETQLAKQQSESQKYEQERETARQANDARQQTVRTIYRDRPVPAGCEPPPDALRLLDDALAGANQHTGKPGATVPADR